MNTKDKLWWIFWAVLSVVLGFVVYFSSRGKSKSALTASFTELAAIREHTRVQKIVLREGKEAALADLAEKYKDLQKQDELKVAARYTAFRDDPAALAAALTRAARR